MSKTLVKVHYNTSQNVIPSVTISVRNANCYGRKILKCLPFLQFAVNFDKILNVRSGKYKGEGFGIVFLKKLII